MHFRGVHATKCTAEHSVVLLLAATASIEEVGMNEIEVIEAAKAKWNAEADQFNQWETLGCDEKLKLVARIALESVAAQQPVAWLTADSERVITDNTKRTLPRAVKAPYTVPLVRARSSETTQDA
jgi:hypothetical protein